MKTISFILFLIININCANTKQLQIYNPYPENEITLGTKNISCFDTFETKIWYALYGSYQLNTVNTKELFTSPNSSYKIEQISTTGDKIISVFAGLFLSISRQTLQIDICAPVKVEQVTENKNRPIESDKTNESIISDNSKKPTQLDTSKDSIKLNESKDSFEIDETEETVESDESDEADIFTEADDSSTGDESEEIEVSSETENILKISQLEKENSFLKGKIAGIESTFSIVAAVPNEGDIEKKEEAPLKDEISNRSMEIDLEKENMLKDSEKNLIPNHPPVSYFLFRSNSIFLNRKEKKKLIKMNSFLAKSKSSILIVGYADKTGNFRSNLNLSWKRAAQVKKMLVKLGLEESKIHMSAAGGTGSRKSRKEIKFSRRVELYVLEEKL